jgi:ABC-2 type transport system permease protein
MSNTLRNIWLVGRREFLAYVSAWGFWISLITTPLLLLALVFAPALLRRAEPTRLVTIISQSAEPAQAIAASFERAERGELRGALERYVRTTVPGAGRRVFPAFDAAPDPGAALAAAREALGAAGASFRPPAPRYRFVPPPTHDPAALAPYLLGQTPTEGGSLFAAFVIAGEGDALRLDYWSANLTDNAPSNRAREALEDLMRRQALLRSGLNAEQAARIDVLEPAYDQHDPRGRPGEVVTARDRAPFVAAAALSLILWSAVLGAANMLLTGVIEEKSNKILDALLTAVTPLQILAGKLLGVAAVSATLFAVWGVFALAGLSAVPAGPAGGLAMAAAGAAFNSPLALTFLLLFAAGYALYGGLFLGLGALCDSLQEAQSLLGPIFLVMTVPIMLIGPAFANPHSPIVAAASWFPLFSPFVLMMRAPAGLTFDQAIGPVLVLGLGVVGMLIAAARLFSLGVSQQLSFAALRAKVLDRAPKVRK